VGLQLSSTDSSPARVREQSGSSARESQQRLSIEDNPAFEPSASIDTALERTFQKGFLAKTATGTSQNSLKSPRSVRNQPYYLLEDTDGKDGHAATDLGDGTRTHRDNPSVSPTTENSVAVAPQTELSELLRDAEDILSTEIHFEIPRSRPSSAGENETRTIPASEVPIMFQPLLPSNQTMSLAEKEKSIEVVNSKKELTLPSADRFLHATVLVDEKNAGQVSRSLKAKYGSIVQFSGKEASSRITLGSEMIGGSPTGRLQLSHAREGPAEDSLISSPGGDQAKRKKPRRVSLMYGTFPLILLQRMCITLL
jgi:hypothetical protein